MTEPRKSTVDEIRARFDADVERFSQLETGQTATMDAVLALDLIADAAQAATPTATRLLDLGCGAGNYSLKILQRVPDLDVTLVDLSAPMLTRAEQRVRAATTGTVTTIQRDLREIDFGTATFDIVVAAAVLHHLRGDEEWRHVFQSLANAVAPGGCLWIFDLVEATDARIQAVAWRQYGHYLTTFGGDALREKVFTYIDREDTPRPLMWQCDRLREAGFQPVEILHKHGPFAAFGGLRPITHSK